MIGRRRLLTAALLLPVGIVVSHSLGYLAAGTDPHAREHVFTLLHDDLTNLGGLAAAAVLLTLLLERRGASSGRAMALPFVALTIGQCTAYAAMEVSQRTTHGISLSEALGEPGLRLGLAIQVVIACCAWLLIRVTRAVVQALRSIPKTPPAPALRSFAATAGASWTPHVWTPRSRRGPPLSLAL